MGGSRGHRIIVYRTAVPTVIRCDDKTRTKLVGIVKRPRFFMIYLFGPRRVSTCDTLRNQRVIVLLRNSIATTPRTGIVQYQNDKMTFAPTMTNK